MTMMVVRMVTVMVIILTIMMSMWDFLCSLATDMLLFSGDLAMPKF